MSEHYEGTLPLGLEPHHVAEHLPYNVATAVVYLLRSPYKHDRPLQDYLKAIDHLFFELKRQGLTYDTIHSALKWGQREEPDRGRCDADRYEEEEKARVAQVSLRESRNI